MPCASVRASGQISDISDAGVRNPDGADGGSAELDGSAAASQRHAVCKHPPGMSPASLSQELLRQIDLLITSVSDDWALCQGLLRERERLAAHLHNTVEPWLRSCQLSPGRPSPRRQRPRPRQILESACQRQHRARRHGYLSLRGISYLALDAELIDARIFDRLQLLGRRAIRVPVPPGLQVYASSSSPSAGGGSTGVVSGAMRSGTPIGAGCSPGPSPLPSRTKRSSVSTSLAWA